MGAGKHRYITSSNQLDCEQTSTSVNELEFNVDHYDVLHFGKSKQERRTFIMNSTTLESVAQQWDPGIPVPSSLNVVSQIDRVAKKAHRTMAFS